MDAWHHVSISTGPDGTIARIDGKVVVLDGPPWCFKAPLDAAGTTIPDASPPPPGTPC